MQYVLVGFVVATSIGVFFDLILQPIFKISAIGSLGSIGTVFISMAVAYAILRYRFFDIQVAIKKGLVQFFTFGILFSIYTYLILLLQKGVKDSFNFSEGNAVLVTVLLIVITIEPLRKLIYNFVDKLFVSREHSGEDALQRVELVSRSTMQFKALVEKVLHELSKVFGRKVDFLLWDKSSGKIVSYLTGNITFSQTEPLAGALRDGRVLVTEELPYRIEDGETSLATVLESLRSKAIALVMPLGVGEECIGALVFPKDIRKPVFTSDKIALIKKFGHQATLAFTNGLAYKTAIERAVKPNT